MIARLWIMKVVIVSFTLWRVVVYASTITCLQSIFSSYRQKLLAKNICAQLAIIQRHKRWIWLKFLFWLGRNVLKYYTYLYFSNTIDFRWSDIEPKWLLEVYWNEVQRYVIFQIEKISKIRGLTTNRSYDGKTNNELIQIIK